MTRADLERAGIFIGEELARLPRTDLDAKSWEKFNAARKGKGKKSRATVSDAASVEQDVPDPTADHDDPPVNPARPKAPDASDLGSSATTVHEVCASVGLNDITEKLLLQTVDELKTASFGADRGALKAHPVNGVGVETVAIIDAGGGQEVGDPMVKRVDGIGEGDAHSVGIPEDMVYEASRSSGNLVIVHTHPSSISLSASDLRNIVEKPMVKANTIVAVGRDGSFYAATVKPNMTYTERRRVSMEVDNQLSAAARVARQKAMAVLRVRVKLPDDVAHAGSTEAHLQAAASAQGVDVDAIFAAALSMVRGPALRRAQKNLDAAWGPGLFKYDEYVPEAIRAANARKAADLEHVG